MDVDAVERLVAADALAQDRIETQAAAQVVAQFQAIDDWADHDAITAASRRAGETTRSAAQLGAASADAYMTRTLTDVLGGTPRTAGALRIADPVRLGVNSWATAYGRVADTVRFEMSRGKSLDDAVAVGLKRAEAMVSTDLALARRQQWQRSLLANPQVIGWRRVIHPELSRTGTCGLCIAAADRTYTKDVLAPLHARCKCTVAPVTRAHDPGGTLNDRDLAAVYESAASYKGKDLKKVRFRVVDHGELGPTLVDVDHRWRGPAQVAAAA